MISEAIAAVVDRKILSAVQMEGAFSEIMSGAATPAQIAGLVIALRMRGETPTEIAAAARVMRAHAVSIPVSTANHCDTCGTGGDGAGTFNISTTAAFVVAALGIPVAKHGNRGVSSRSGSSDVLAALGIDIEATPQAVARAIDLVGIGFLFAPLYHGALKHAAAPRRELGVRTFFNLLGPLANPAGAPYQVMGLYDGNLVPIVANALCELGARGALVVHGSDGLDEITLTGPTRIAEVHDDAIQEYTLDPRQLGLTLCRPSDLLGGDPAHNAQITEAILGNEISPRRDIVALNAAAALIATAKEKDWNVALARAQNAIASGAALEKLRALRRECGVAQ